MGFVGRPQFAARLVDIALQQQKKSGTWADACSQWEAAVIGIPEHGQDPTTADPRSVYGRMYRTLAGYKNRRIEYIQHRALWTSLDWMVAAFRFVGAIKLHMERAFPPTAEVDLVKAGVASMELRGRAATFKLTEPQVAETLCRVLADVGVAVACVRRFELLPRMGLPTGVQVSQCVWLCVCGLRMCVCVFRAFAHQRAAAALVP